MKILQRLFQAKPIKQNNLKTAFSIDFYKMPSKTKKSRASGRFGARYGRRVRQKFADVESKQRVKQKCPYCNKLGVKRKAKGIWSCAKCGKTFASNTYYLE